MLWMKSDLSYYYTDIIVELQSSSGNYKTFTIATAALPEVSGDFHSIVLDYVNKGTETGTFVPANLSVIRVTVDNSSSGNIRSVINNWIDAMYYGPGLTVSGTTTGDKLFTEAAAIDQNGTNEYGILENYSGIIYSQGDIDFSGTAQTSDGETLVFKQTTNGYDTYNLDITGTVDLVGSNVLASGTAKVNLDATSATSFSMLGGTLKNIGALTLVSGQTFDGVVATSVDTSSIANDPVGTIWNQSGLITLTATGSLEGCTLYEPTGALAVSVNVLDDLDGCIITSDGTGHVAELTITADGTQGWNCNDSGYAATDGSTGNETLKVNITSPDVLTINVAAGATTPTIYKVGTGTVDVVSGLIDLEVTVLDDSTGLGINLAHVRLMKESDKSVLISKATNSSGYAKESITYDADTDVVGWARQMDLLGTDYEQKDFSGQYTANGFSITVRLTPIS